MNNEQTNPVAVDTTITDAHAAQELARVKAERARIAAQREQRAKAAEAADELPGQLRALENEKAIDAAEAKYGPLGAGKIAAVHSRAGVVILKKPHHILFRKFQDKGDSSADAYEVLVGPCLVHPDRAAFDAYVEELPALLQQCADEVCILAGVQVKSAQGK